MILSVVITGIVMLLLKLFGRISPHCLQMIKAYLIGTEICSIYGGRIPTYITIEIFSGLLSWHRRQLDTYDNDCSAAYVYSE